MPESGKEHRVITSLRRLMEAIQRRKTICRQKKLRKLIIWGNLIDCVGYLTIGIFSALRYRPLPVPDEVKNILAIRLDHIGDVLMTTPFLHALRLKFSKARITVLIAPWSIGLLEDNPDIDEILVLDPLWYHPGSKEPNNIREVLNLIRTLRKKRFDLVFNIRNDETFGSFLSYVTGAPHRIGYSLRAGGFFLTDQIPLGDPYTRHTVESALDLIRYTYGEVPHPRLFVPFAEEDKSYVDKLFLDLGIKQCDLLVSIHPGVRNPVKDWFSERFSLLADALIQKYKAQILFIGSSEDRDKIQRIVSGMKETPFILAGKANLRQLAEIIRRSHFLISLDSMAGHLAAAVGTPVVVIYGGFTDPRRFGPYTEKSVIVRVDLPCAPCQQAVCSSGKRECLEKLTVEMVLGHIDKNRTLLLSARDSGFADFHRGHRPEHRYCQENLEHRESKNPRA